MFIFFGVHLYGYLPDGALSIFRATTEHEVKAFYQTYDMAKNSGIVIVGNVTRGEIKAAVKEMTAGLLSNDKVVPQLSETKIPEKPLYQRTPFLAQQDALIIAKWSTSL